MSTAEKVMLKVAQLSYHRQCEVLQFVEQLEAKPLGDTTAHDSYGALADLSIDITMEDFQQNRRELWGEPEKKFFK